MDEFGWRRFFVELSSLLDSCQAQIGLASENFANYVVERLESGLRNVSMINETLTIACEPENELGDEEERVICGYQEMAEELCSSIRSLLCYWDSYIDELGSMSTSAVYGYRASVIPRPGIRGCPAFSVEKNQIEYLRSLRFSWTEISNLIGVCRMTLYRRRREFDMLQTPTQEVSSEELTGIVQKLKNENPYCGETMIMGHLRAMDVVVTRERVRSVIRRIDPLNTALRWGGNSTTRRPYSVPGPNSLWHLGEYVKYEDSYVHVHVTALNITSA